MACLEIFKGEQPGTKFALADEVVLGRNSGGRDRENFVHLADVRISRRHARIVRIGWIFLLEDLGSSNGTILRGQLIPPHTPCDLYDGDEIWISSYRLVFYLEEATLVAQPPRRVDFDYWQPSEENLARPTETIVLEPGAFSVMLMDEDLLQSTVSIALDIAEVIPEKSTILAATQTLDQELTLKRLQAMCEVSMALGVITDQNRLMQRILDCVFDMFPLVERAFILLRDHQGEGLVPVVVRQRHTQDKDEEVQLSRSIINEVIRRRRAILSIDTQQDVRFQSQESIHSVPIRSVMCAPFLVGNEVLGIIQADTPTPMETFTSKDLQVFAGISAQAAIAIKNIQLHNAVKLENAQRISLQRYFSPPLVDMLMSGDLTTELGGQTYQGTILFADIIGFTAMSERMAAPDIVTRLNQFFTIMQRSIYENGGNVDKFGGDDIMAFWGVPRLRDEDVLDAVRTALQMQAKLWASNLNLESDGQPPLHMGIGLNAGEFVAGNIGSTEKIEFTVIGDSVNLAARLVKLASRYQVFVSESIWNALKAVVCAVQLPLAQLRGKSQPTPVYSIRAAPLRSRSTHAMALPCYLLNPTGQRIGRGIVTESTRADNRLRLFFSTDTPLNPGEELILQARLPEYHKAVVFSARVESCAIGTYEGGTAYTKAILQVFRGRTLDAFLRPGSCLVSSYTWENLPRH